jgi:multidrug efflux pump subunit AcrA (membrane-fusion protein)
MIGNSTAQTRLCPYCANSIAEDATDCSYCKADFSSQFAPPWLKRDEPAPEPQIAPDNRKKIPAKFIWMGGMLVVALIAFFAGGYIQRSELSLASQANLKQLQAKDQMIQTQEAQLAQTRQQLNENSNQFAEMKTKLEASQKDLSLTQQRLNIAARQADRLNASRPPVARRTASRAPDTAASVPQPVATRRTAAPGVYETVRATSVHEDASSTSRVISQIDGRTRINVVNSAGGWLEVRSKRGNPPGYVRSDDARLIGGAS